MIDVHTFNWIDLFTVIIQAIVIAIAIGLALSAVIVRVGRSRNAVATIRALTPDELERKYTSAAQRAYNAAEWVYSNIQNAGPEKLKYAKKVASAWLKAQGIHDVNLTAIEAAIELIVEAESGDNASRRLPPKLIKLKAKKQNAYTKPH